MADRKTTTMFIDQLSKAIIDSRSSSSYIREKNDSFLREGDQWMEGKIERSLGVKMSRL